MSFLADLLGPQPAFEGGLFLSDHKADTARRPIERLSVKGPLHVPLTVRADLETRSCVAVGDTVQRGERLALAIGHDSVPVHAPVAGRIGEFSRVWSPSDGFLPCVVVEPGDQDQAVPQRQGWEDESIIVQLAEKGVVCPSPRAPLHHVLQQAIAAGVTDLIINAMETEPFLTADLRTLVEQPGRIVDAACELADALGVERAIIAMPFRHRRVERRMKAEVDGRHVEIAAMANAYPQCHAVMLVKALLDREVAPGGSTLEEGVVVLPLAAVRYAADALLDDRPVTDTVMAVAGSAVDRPGTYSVAIGTPIGRLAERVGLVSPVARAVWGGPLTGLAILREEAVVTTDTAALLLFAEADLPEPVPCIHCGWCVEDCPVGIDPPGLMHLESSASCSKTELAGLRACLDCALCSYVCPAQLPLGETIHHIRTRLERSQQPAETAQA